MYTHIYVYLAWAQALHGISAVFCQLWLFWQSLFLESLPIALPAFIDCINQRIGHECRIEFQSKYASACSWDLKLTKLYTQVKTNTPQRLAFLTTCRSNRPLAIQLLPLALAAAGARLDAFGARSWAPRGPRYIWDTSRDPAGLPPLSQDILDRGMHTDTCHTPPALPLDHTPRSIRCLQCRLLALALALGLVLALGVQCLLVLQLFLYVVVF